MLGCELTGGAAMTKAATTAAPVEISAFAGFGPQALAFFKALDFHQDRTWFQDNRALYEREVRAPMAALIEALSAACAARGLPLRGDPKRSQFRIYRDTRVSHDKRPYKTNAGATLTRDGEKLGPGVLYLHLDPKGCFMAAALYRPEPAVLRTMRERIIKDPAKWRRVVKALDKAGLPLARTEALTRLPRGFEAAEGEIAEAMKLRHFMVRREIAETRIRAPALVADIADFATAARPLLDFVWAAADSAPREDMALRKQ
jgi:uncharacterized protein (TIGR02453 family)